MTKDEIRELAENNLEAFIRLVHPGRVLGSIHSEVISWWTREEAKKHQLLLLPRDHMKSALVAYRVAQRITKEPSVRILYVSATANLANKQLKFIKDILTCEAYRFYWPEMCLPEEGKREKWTETEIAVDHPRRKEEAIRDPTIFAAGLTTTITGMHCDISVLDDVVVYENAYTEEGRQKVKSQYSLLSSIEGTDAEQWVVGTRYHPKDLYKDLIDMAADQYDDTGELIGSEQIYEVMERQVEDRGDGTGQFLWPRQQRYDGKVFGFDASILARKRAQYLDKTQFRAQYYNDPNDISSVGTQRENFQYYEPKHLRRDAGKWSIKGRPMNVFAAVDFAFSLSKKADYTAIVVIGVDSSNNYYVLDIERFRSDKISDYFSKILSLHQKWDFRKIRAEVTVAQAVIVEDLKTNYIRPYGLALSIESYRPTRNTGSKEERMQAILQPRYNNMQIWHYPGGNCQILEEELLLAHPPHDDVKDCLASVIDCAVPPSHNISFITGFQDSGLQTHSRFGGIH